MIDKKLFLRVTLKLFTGFAFICLVYIFLADFFIDTNKSAPSHQFDISSLLDKQAAYFFIDRRELLVLKHQDKLSVFWANDPVYGCRLEFFVDYIKPVCIDIRYGVDGYNAERDQWLLSPDYEVSLGGELVVY